jgi:hypothetical protein
MGIRSKRRACQNCHRFQHDWGGLDRRLEERATCWFLISALLTAMRRTPVYNGKEKAPGSDPINPYGLCRAFFGHDWRSRVVTIRWIRQHILAKRRHINLGTWQNLSSRRERWDADPFLKLEGTEGRTLRVPLSTRASLAGRRAACSDRCAEGLNLSMSSPCCSGLQPILLAKNKSVAAQPARTTGLYKQPGLSTHDDLLIDDYHNV